jgi:hypothetical protein
MPFSFEAVVICASAFGTAIWCEMLLHSRNVLSAVITLWMVAICMTTGIVYLVRWVALP